MFPMSPALSWMLVAALTAFVLTGIYVMHKIEMRLRRHTGAAAPTSTDDTEQQTQPHSS